MSRFLSFLFAGLAITTVAHAANDRYVVASFTNGTSTQPGGVKVTLDLTVFNDINNLQYPSHFVQWVQTTIPSGFTGSGANGAFTTSDFVPPAGWTVSSISTKSGNSIITFISSSTDYTFTAGTSRTFLIKTTTPAAACGGPAIAFSVIANQSTNGGQGNTYPNRPGAQPPSVLVSGCVTATYLVMNSVSPASIFTTGNGQAVTLTATLTTLAHDALGNPIPGTPIANEPIIFDEGSAGVTCQGGTPMTNSSGVATCDYTPLTGPITPLTAGNYDESASFAGDTTTVPNLAPTNSTPKQLTVSTTDTSLTVPDVVGNYLGAVTLTATLATGAGQTGVPGQTITFSINTIGVVCGGAGQPVCPVTDSNGLATLSNVSISPIVVGSYPGAISASYAGNGTYSAVTNTAKLTVTQVGQTISFTGPGDQPLVNGSVNISATAYLAGTPTPSNLAISFSGTSGICSAGTGTLQPSGATTASVTFQALGLCTITANQSGNVNLGPATPVSQSFNIINTAMTCNLGNLSATYTSAPQAPTCTTSLSGVSCSVSGAPQTNAGSYQVLAVPPTGYSCSATASFVIKQAPLGVRASSPSITYGSAVPAITPSYSGFLSSDGPGVVSSLICSTTYTKGSPVGGYPSNCSGGVATNYSLSYTPGSVSVTQATLTVTASSLSVSFNDPVPTILPNYSGFQGSDSASSLATAPTCLTSYTQGSNVGTYPTSCSGGVATNYTLSYVPGLVTVGQASQTITINSFIVAATATSGGTVTFNSGTPAICTVGLTTPPTNGSNQYTALVTLLPGITDWTTCKVLADQTGSSNYKAAPEATARLGNPTL